MSPSLCEDPRALCVGGGGDEGKINCVVNRNDGLCCL